MLSPADLEGSLRAFGHASETFFDGLQRIGWTSLGIGLLLTLAMQLLRAHAWSNAIRAAYPEARISERRVVAAFLVGAGLNGILPAHGGDALKVVLAKRNIEGSSYPTVISSFAVLSPFDTGMGILILIYAVTQGLLPKPPALPHIAAFDISFWAAHPRLLAGVGAALVVGAVVGLIMLARRAESVWSRVKQGLVILTQPRRYAREVAAWQAAGWACRFASIWLFLDAFHIGGSIQTVLLVMSVRHQRRPAVHARRRGREQALLVATLHGASRTAVLAYSVGQQIAVTAWSVVIGFASLVLVFRITDWRSIVRERDAEEAAEGG